jgi:hypothetical protein
MAMEAIPVALGVSNSPDRGNHQSCPSLWLFAIVF